MKRVSRRQLERALRAPAPPPPEGLSSRIKAGIPQDLVGARRTDGEQVEATTPVREGRGRAAWAIAATLVATLGAGWLATRLFDQRAAEVLEPARSNEPVAKAPVAPAAAVDALAPKQAEEPAAPPAASAGARRQEPALRVSAPESVVAEELAAPSKRAVETDQAQAQAPVAEAKSPPLPATEAVPEREERPALARAAAARDAMSDRPDSLASALAAERDRSTDAGTDALVAAARGLAVTGAEIAVEGASSAAEGRVVLLVTARVDGPSTLELELDPALATGYRRLASSTSVDRVSALYELELRSPPPAGAALGVVRVRREGASKAAESGSRTITAGDVATDWREARPELRDAVLATRAPRHRSKD